MHANKHQRLYKVALSVLVDVTRHVQSILNRKLVIFLQYIIKSFGTAFVSYCDARCSDILWGSSHVLCHMLVRKLNSLKISLLKFLIPNYFYFNYKAYTQLLWNYMASVHYIQFYSTCVFWETCSFGFWTACLHYCFLDFVFTCNFLYS